MSEIANDLAGAGFITDSVVTLDAFGGASLNRPGHHVTWWANFYERGGGLPGYTMDGADIEKDVSNEAGQMTITAAPSVVKKMTARITSILAATAPPTVPPPPKKVVSV